MVELGFEIAIMVAIATAMLFLCCDVVGVKMWIVDIDVMEFYFVHTKCNKICLIACNLYYLVSFF